MKEKKITVLGSTGSIGIQTLDVVRRTKELKVVSLAACRNIDLLEEQIREFHPECACVYDEGKALELKKRLAGQKVEVLAGMEGMVQCASLDASDMVVTAVVGMIGIRPVIEAIRAGKDIAFANKETLVTAGHLIMPLVQEKGVKLLPVDSEHAAIFQCLNGENAKELAHIILTASGGPFRGKKREELAQVTVEDALKHPNWSMGKKITIDSSTMVNKGLEVIEARWLFDVDFDNIQVVLQPESVIHSMVEFCDGAVMAQLGTPDMRLPIQYALMYPCRAECVVDRLDFTKLSGITFGQPDLETFRGLKLAFEAGRTGGSMPTVFNAANEKAVELFLNRRISWLTMAQIIEEAMEGHHVIQDPSLEEILEVEREVYRKLENQYGM